MKILFCQTQFKMGGQQKVLLTLARELSKDHDVTIYYENHNFFNLNGLKTIQPSKSFYFSVKKCAKEKVQKENSC